MKIRFIILCLLSYSLIACTALNDKCNKLAEGNCWPDVNRCGIPRQPNLEICKQSDWYCGSHVDFGDP